MRDKKWFLTTLLFLFLACFAGKVSYVFSHGADIKGSLTADKIEEILSSNNLMGHIIFYIFYRNTFLDRQASLAPTPVSLSVHWSVTLSDFHFVSVSEPSHSVK